MNDPITPEYCRWMASVKAAMTVMEEESWDWEKVLPELLAAGSKEKLADAAQYDALIARAKAREAEILQGARKESTRPARKASPRWGRRSQ